MIWGFYQWQEGPWAFYDFIIVIEPLMAFSPPWTPLWPAINNGKLLRQNECSD